MVRQLRRRYGRASGAWLADAGFLANTEIEEFGAPDSDTTLYLPVRTPEDPSRDPYLPLPSDSPALASWRTRMSTPAAKEIYKDRAATAECVNAIARNRGLQRFRVRGRDKARAILLWFALAHNLMRTIRFDQRQRPPWPPDPRHPGRNGITAVSTTPVRPRIMARGPVQLPAGRSTSRTPDRITAAAQMRLVLRL